MSTVDPKRSMLLALNLGIAVNLVLESLGEWNQSVDEGDIEQEFTFTVNPGMRYAFNFMDAQLVLGLAAPCSFSEEERDFGAFLYPSYEHKLFR